MAARSSWADKLRHPLIGVTAATTIAAISPVWAQVAPSAPQPLSPPAAYPSPYRYPFPGLAPRDAYRAGLINRWELEQVEGWARERWGAASRWASGPAGAALMVRGSAPPRRYR